VRQLELDRGPARPLPTKVWYPIGEGRFPIVLFSHGLGGQPEGFADVTVPLAAAGFVVVAPAYPHTKKGAKAFNRNDIANQPADAQHVLDKISELDTLTGDTFQGRLATSRLCAAGFSAGGYTTAGMFTPQRSRKLRCGIVISGAVLDANSFTGRPAPILFLHGDADKVVVYPRGRSAYDNLKWPKGFVTFTGQGHGDFLVGKNKGFPAALATIRDFLRWNLYGDAAARTRLPEDGTLDRVALCEVRF
jgi:dienelactone hydrolase